MTLAIVSVTNDLTTDQRVDRTCRTLVKMGYHTLLVGRLRSGSLELAPRSYDTKRLRLHFDKGPLFYAEFNIRLFFFLLGRRSDLLVSNDLDTLPATFLAYRIRSIFSHGGKKGRHAQHLHDCHEYFRGVPELVGRKRVTLAWKWMEDRIFPRLKHVIAVNGSVARLYEEEYGIPVGVVRNMPFRKEPVEGISRAAAGIGEGQRVILYQGAVNVDRGLEEAVLAMKHVQADAVLLIAGTGDIFDGLHRLVKDHGLEARVSILGQIPFQELHRITVLADLGLSIEKDVSINYRLCLPNKLLDYIQARVPVLVSPFPEMEVIVTGYGIGEFITGHEPETLAAHFDRMLSNPEGLAAYRLNLEKAAAELCWENEQNTLAETIRRMMA